MMDTAVRMQQKRLDKNRTLCMMHGMFRSRTALRCWDQRSRGPAGALGPPGPGLEAPWVSTRVNVSTFGDFLQGPQRKR